MGRNWTKLFNFFVSCYCEIVHDIDKSGVFYVFRTVYLLHVDALSVKESSKTINPIPTKKKSALKLYYHFLV